ncbi:hypothetical protein IJF81_04890, partial [bacterium]|nr:hypothetical protein [bacterium]
AGEYSYNDTQGYHNDDIISNIIITRTNLTKDGSGNLQFSSNVGDGSVVTGTETYTIYVDDKITLNQDGDGSLYFKKITGQDEAGNNIYQDVKVGKVDSNGVFTEIYGDNDLFNQAAYYTNNETTQSITALKDAYAKDDYIVGGAGSQKIYGGDGADVIYGANLPVYDDEGNLADIDTSSDTIYGGDGSDYIIGGAGNDFIDGGEGADEIYAGEGDDIIVGGRGVRGSAGTYDNTYVNADVLKGEGGNDTIYSVGKYKNDGSLDMTINAQGEITDDSELRQYLGDYSRGLDENTEHIYSKNAISGGAGDDKIIANGWWDIVDGGDGDDTIDVYSKYDPMYYHEGDPLYANQNKHEIDGGAGDDTITLYGEAIGGTVSGGAGNDTIDASHLTLSSKSNIKWNYTPKGVTIDGGDGDNTIVGSIGDDSISVGYGNSTINAGAGDDSISMHGGGGSFAGYYSGKSIAHGGEGNDTIIGAGNDELYGDEGNDTLYFATGQTGTVIHPSHVTLNGGEGDDIYIEDDGIGYDTLIASAGNDVIKFTNVKSDSMSMYRQGNDLVIKHATAYGVVGGGVNNDNLLILKDYYSNSTTYTDSDGVTQTYRDSQGNPTTAKALFDNYRIELYDQDTRGMMRNTFTFSDFVKYATGAMRIIYSGSGTSANDYIEARNTVTDINAGAGDDTVIAGSGTKTISGGEGNDLIQGNQNAEVQFITGDNGKVTNVVINSEQYGSTSGQYSYTYTPGSSEGAGNDNITLYANNNFVWAEEGDDIIVDSADGVDHINRIWAGAGDDAIKANGMILDGGAGDDTIIGGGEVIDGGSGNDTIKASSINHSYYSGFYENKQQLLINKYSELGVNTQEALEIRDDLIELGENLREAITNRNSATSSLNVSSYGTDAYYLDYYIRSRDYQQDYVDQYTEALEKMDPDSESYSSNYSWNLNQLADYEIQRDSYQRSVDTYQAKVDQDREELETYTNLVNQYKASIADKIEELRTKGYYEFVNNYGNAYSNNVVLGGSGDDEITIGYKEEKDGYLSGNFYVAGGEDDDTYIIPDYYYEDENTGEIYHQLNMKAQICDVEGQNTLLLQSQNLTSGNLGILINVTLKTDNEGNYVRDGQGNYEYTIENFKTYTQYSDTSWSPKGDGDMGFSIILTDSKNYQEAASDYYGGYGTAGIRLDEDTLEHLTRIQAYDGKYITIDQIYKVAQNTANWLGEHGYSDYQTAVGLDDVVDYTQSKINKEELLGYKALGSLEWLEDGNITTGVTEGTEGTYLRDTLTSTSDDEEFNLYSGSDIVTFEGAFGNDIINSTSEVDADGNAVQTDILNFKEYSIKDGNLTVELVGNDLRFTAYGGDGTLAGTATYKNVIGTAYNARTVIINDRDGEHKLLTEDAYSMKQDGYKFLSIYNNSSADTANHLVILNSSGEVTVQLNGSKNYNYTVADENTTLNYSGYGSGDIVPDKDIIVSKGETDDKYGFKFTAETDVIIDDMGGNDSLSILSGSNWYNQSDDVRLFFDVDYQGNVGESSNLIYKDCFTADNAKNIANLLDGVHTMKGVITFNGELESFETRDYSSSYLVTNGIIKLNEWKQAIAKNVSAWLQANGYRDVKQALATGNRALISAMIKLFDVTYSDAKAGNLEFSLYTDKSDNNVQTTLIKGTAARDYINLPDNTGSRFVVKSDNGDDVIKGNADNSYIDTGEGSDFINVTGNNNVINAGDSYNVINITGTGENSTNTLEVSGDNGATDLIKANNTNLTLKFDEKSIYLNFFKLGDRLGIKYHPSGSNHYLYLDNYFKEGNNVEYTAVCADKTITIKDLLQEWQSKDNVLQEGTTSYYDGVNIEIPSNTANDITVNSSYSSDKITGENLENVTINANVYGDEINISGTNNIIKSGEGRDYTYVRGAGENSSNTVVYANDGCRDTLGGENTALTLQFKDSVYSD